MAVKEVVKDAVKVSRKTFFNPRAWLGYDAVRDETVFIWQLFKTIIRPLFVSQKPLRQETFEEAMQRQQVTETDINEAGQLYFLFASFFGLLAVLMLIVSVLFLLKGQVFASLISLAMIIFLLAQAFKYHFWFFQIKHKKLGCTFEEWRKGKPD